MTLTVRLDSKIDRLLKAAAKRRGVSRSDVVREALEQYEARDLTPRGNEPYHAWLDVIGVVDLGVRQTSVTTGEQLTSILRQRRRARTAD
jgi:hypothetical protein